MISESLAVGCPVYITSLGQASCTDTGSARLDLFLSQLLDRKQVQWFSRDAKIQAMDAAKFSRPQTNIEFVSGAVLSKLDHLDISVAKQR